MEPIHLHDNLIGLMWNKLFCMTIRSKELCQDKVGAAPIPNQSRSSPDGSNGNPLRVLAEFYESGQGLDEEENEVDLMVQLSGMVYSHAQGEE